MGCFDTVYANCPACNEEVKFQSKAGSCNLRIYSSKDVPIEIASDLDGETQVCAKCDKTVKISIPHSSPKRIPMEVTIGDGTEWD